MNDAASTPGTPDVGLTASTATHASDADLRVAFPSMFEGTPAPTQPITPPTDPDAVARAAFPSMAPATEPAPTPTPEAATATPPAAEAATPVSLPASAIEITVPASLQLDAADLQAFDDTARVLGLDAEGAQKIIDLHAQATANYTAEIDAAWTATRAEWREAVTKDPELGGAKFNETVATARQVIARFGTPALKQAMNDLGIGNHPEIVRLMARVGKALAAQGQGTTAATPAPQSEDAKLRAAFPSMYRK